MLRTIDRALVLDALDMADLDPAEALFENYTGKFMYGDHTFGIVGTPAELAQFNVALGYVARDRGVDPADVLDLVRATATDGMGRDQRIAYFPGWNLDTAEVTT